MKWKLWLNIGTFVALGLLIFLMRHDIIRSIERVRTLNAFVLLLMVPLMFGFFYTIAKFFAAFFKVTERPLPMSVLLPAMIELNFVNHVFPSGGVSGVSYFAWRLRPLGVSTAKSTLAQITRYSLVFVTYIGLMLVSLLLLAVDGQTSSLVVLAISAIAFTLLFGTGVLLFALDNEDRTARFARGLLRLVNRVIHAIRPKHPETIKLDKVEAMLLELHKDYNLIRGDWRQMRSVFLWNVLSSLCELGLLYVVFVAHGLWVNPAGVVVAFVIATTVGLLAIFPGGIGLYEPLMAAVFISVGVPPGIALSVTLIYRTITLVLSLASGALLYQRAIGKHGTADV